MAPQPTAQAAQPPPDLPYDPKLSDAVSQYLRNFALWCRNGFADRLPARQALPGIMIQAVDATTGQPLNVTYMLTVKATYTPPAAPTAPTIVLTLMPSGSGAP